jgi:hypothetical protein
MIQYVIVEQRSTKNQNDSCTFERQSTKPRHHKLSKQKDISINIDNHRTSCCCTQLFHPKSILHIQDEENRLFSIVSLQTSQNDKQRLTQRTEEYVDQIFDLIMHNTVTDDADQYCQTELVLPLYTQSQLMKIQAISSYF